MADDAGKLPDQNAGETLARVVGVAVTTDQGEGRYVTIRGIDAALSNVTIDGQIIGSPVTVFYTKSGDRMIANKVVVKRTTTTVPRG